MPNGIDDLRNHLFEVIELLKKPVGHKNTLDFEAVEAICLMSKCLLESAEIEIEYRKLTEQIGPTIPFLSGLPSGGEITEQRVDRLDNAKVETNQLPEDGNRPNE